MLSKGIRILAVILAGLCCTLALAGCGNGSQDKTAAYYRDVAITPTGEFVFKDKIDEAAVKNGSLYYYVETGQDGAPEGKVSRVTAMDGDEPINIPWKSTVGGLEEFTGTQVRLDYSEEGYIREEYEDTHDVNSTGHTKTRVTRRFKIIREGANKGKPETIYYYDNEGKNKVGFDLSRADISYNENGKADTISYFNKDGISTTGKMGANILKLVYGGNHPDAVSAVEIRDYNGKLMNNNLQFARIAFSYDEKGRVTDSRAYNEKGDPAETALLNEIPDLHPERLNYAFSMIRSGIIRAGAETQYLYDGSHAGPVKIRFLGADGQPLGIAGSIGEGIAGLDITYDGKDHITGLKITGPDGRPAAVSFSGVSGPDELKMEYDGNGNITKISYFRNNEPVSLTLRDGKTNISSVHYKYNNHRHVTEETYFDTAGAPTYLTVYGTTRYYGRGFIYNESNPGFSPDVMYLDENGQKIKSPSKGYILGTWQEYGWEEWGSGEKEAGRHPLTLTFNSDGTVKADRPDGPSQILDYEIDRADINNAGQLYNMKVTMTHPGKDDAVQFIFRFDEDEDHFNIINADNDPKFYHVKKES